MFSISDVSIKKRTEADPDKIYSVELSRSGTKQVGLEQNPQGLPSAASASATDAIIPNVTEGLKLVATIVGKVLSFTRDADLEEDLLTPCQNAKKKILEIREEIRGLYSHPGSSGSKELLEYKQAKLIIEMKKLEGLFTGVIPGKVTTVTCEVTPKKEEGTASEFEKMHIDLFKWSSDGIVYTEATKDAPSKEPRRVRCNVPTILLRDTISEGRTLQLTLEPLDSTVAVKAPLKSKEKARSYYYRIPAYARVSMQSSSGEEGTAKTKTLTEEKIWAIPQLGETHSIPRLKAGGKVELEVAFDPETGALTKLGIKRQSLDVSGMLKAATEAAGSIADPLVEAAKKDSELLDYQRQQAIAEAIISIKAAEALLAEKRE